MRNSEMSEKLSLFLEEIMNLISGIMLFLALASSVAAEHITDVSRDGSVTSIDAPAIPEMAEVPT